MHIAIRQIGCNDLPIVQALAQKIWPASFHIFLSNEQIKMMLSRIYALETLQEDIEIHNHRYWLASDGKQDIAFVSAYVKGNTVWVKKLYVLPEFHGYGIGKRLIQTAQKIIKEPKQLSLYVNEHNAPAIQRYQNMGFEIKEKKPVIMGGLKFCDYIMSKKI